MKTKHLAFIIPAVLGLAQTGHAAVLLTDNFNSYAGWDASGVAADQGGTYAGTGYTTSTPVAGWISHSSTENQPFGNNTLKVDTGGGQTFVKVDRNFATDANFADLPLSISFYVQAGGGAETNWAAFTVGSNSNVFITDAANMFGTLFRNSSNDTQQFSSGTNLSGQGTVSYDQPAGSTITLIFSDTAGTGSAFDGSSGSKVAFYVGNSLAQTFTLSQMGANDGYIGFQTYGTRGVFDNLVVQTVPEPAAALLGGLGMLALLRRRR